MSDAEPGTGYVLRLFVTGATARSTRSVANLRRLLERTGGTGYDLQVIDIRHDPEAARDHQVVAAPTLVKLAPAPVRRIVGDLSDEAALRRGLGLAGSQEDGDGAAR